MKPQHNARTCEEAAVVVIQQLCGYLPKKKKDAQDDQRSNKNDESVTNRFADLKTISTVQKHQTKVKSMCIVPVKVKSAPQEKDVLRYAMLDNFSQGSFIQEALVKKMQTSGRKTTLNLKTLNDEISESTTALKDWKFPDLRMTVHEENCKGFIPKSTCLLTRNKLQYQRKLKNETN